MRNRGNCLRSRPLSLSQSLASRISDYDSCGRCFVAGVLHSEACSCFLVPGGVTSASEIMRKPTRANNQASHELSFAHSSIWRLALLFSGLFAHIRSYWSIFSLRFPVARHRATFRYKLRIPKVYSPHLIFVISIAAENLDYRRPNSIIRYGVPSITKKRLVQIVF